MDQQPQSKLRFSVCVLILISTLVVAFQPVFFGNSIIAPLDIRDSFIQPWSEDSAGEKPQNHIASDAVTQYLPYRQFAERSFEEDGYLGWNPYEFGGTNLAGNTMALPGSWSTQLHRFLSVSDAWNFSIIAEFFVAGLGMFVFLRSRKLSYLACLIGAVAFMGNTQFITWIHHRWALGSFCWMPWILWSGIGIRSWKEVGLRQMLLPFFLSLAFLGGSLQHIVFVVLGSGCLFMGGVRNIADLKGERSRVVIWSLAFVVTFGLVSYSLIPQVQGYLTNTAIGHTRGGVGYPHGASQPLFNLVLIPAQIWPWLVGDAQTIDGWKVLRSGFLNLAYIGTIPMILAFIGVKKRGVSKEAKWLIVIGLLLPLTPLVGPLYHRVQLLFILGGCWATAEVIHQLKASASKYLIRGVIVCVSVIGFGLVVATILPSSTRKSIEVEVVGQALASSANSQFGSDQEWIEERAKLWVDRFSLKNSKTAWVFTLLAVGAGGLYLSGYSNVRKRRIGNSLILIATSLELYTFQASFVHFSDEVELQPRNNYIERVKERVGDGFVLQTGEGSTITNTFAGPNILSSYGVKTVDGYESIHPRSIGLLTEALGAEESLILSGVKLSVQPVELEAFEGTAGWPIVDRIPGFILRENVDYLGDVIVGKGDVPGDIETVRSRLYSGDVIASDHVTMNSRRILIPEGQSWVRICQNWDRGWKWKWAGSSVWNEMSLGVDGACWIEDLGGRGGEVDLKFEPRSGVIGFISYLALIVWFFVCGMHLHISRRRRLNDDKQQHHFEGNS